MEKCQYTINNQSAISLSARHITPFSCPFKVFINYPFSTPQSFNVPSVLQEIK
jgi:hypothetical protein